MSGATFASVSPVDGRHLRDVPAAGAAEVDRAVRRARATLRDGAWAAAAPGERRRVLQAYAAAVEDAADELATLATAEMGKAVSVARAEAGHAARAIAHYAEAVDKRYGEVAPTAPGELGIVTRVPIGVVGVVTPWNYPLMMPAWKIGPALATGNSVVLKPAEQSPASAVRLVELAHEAGVPEGALQVLTGRGPEAGAALGRHPDVDAIAFTGSDAVGQRFLAYAGESNMKAVSLECGGKSPHVVFPDVADLDAVAHTVAGAVFANAGQMCDAGSRLLVHESLAQELTRRVVELAPEWEPGDPFDPATRVGAIVSTRQLERVEGFVSRALTDGAALAVGGARARPGSGGTYYSPTVLTGVAPASELAQEEVFGPVLAVSTFRTEAEAVSLANGTRHGLAAAVWTSDLGRAARVADRIEAGCVFVNGYDRADLTVPFGGHRRSGLGVDRSLHALDKYTRLKTTWIHWDREPGD